MKALTPLHMKGSPSQIVGSSSTEANIVCSNGSPTSMPNCSTRNTVLKRRALRLDGNQAVASDSNVARAPKPRAYINTATKSQHSCTMSYFISMSQIARRRKWSSYTVSAGERLEQELPEQSQRPVSAGYI